jgi:hypothetical protein
VLLVPAKVCLCFVDSVQCVEQNLFSDTAGNLCQLATFFIRTVRKNACARQLKDQKVPQVTCNRPQNGSGIFTFIKNLVCELNRPGHVTGCHRAGQGIQVIGFEEAKDGFNIGCFYRTIRESKYLLKKRK